MYSLRAGRSLLGLIRAYANARGRGRYYYWLGLTLAAAIVIGAGAGLAREMGDVATPLVTSVPAASYEQQVPLAPDSIIAAYGENLATQVAVATTDDDPNTPGIQLPKQLGGTTVTVNGQPAGLLFVSRRQVNYVMPEGTLVGQANILVRSGDGTISSGTAQIAKVSPAIFTANTDGKGVPAALVYRLKANSEDSYESLSRQIAPGGRFVTKAINMGPEGERVFLILYLCGVRHATPGSVRVVIGGIESIPSYAGPAPGFIALDQVNVEIPRSLIGRNVNVSVTAGVGSLSLSSNLVDIEIAGDGGSLPPRVIGFDVPQALAGQAMIINGSGFSTVATENIVRIAGLAAEVMEATSTSLKVMVPFGVETGTVRVITPSGEGVSESILPVVTSISGVVENTLLQPLADVNVSISNSNKEIIIVRKTDREGHFVLPNIPQEGIYEVEIDGESINVYPPYPKFAPKIAVVKNRDNAFLTPITLQQSTGSSAIVGSGPPSGGGGGNPGIKPRARLGPEPITIPTEGFRLEIEASTEAKFPNEDTIGEIFLTPLQNSRTPVELPLGIFSSSIVQITPFGVELNPGAKLIFPNKDGLGRDESVALFRYDKEAGKFVQEVAKATVSADGKSIETERGAIKITSYYFAAKSRDLTTIRGYVYEKDGRTPVIHALARIRGQESFTDGAGSYLLRYVSVKGDEAVSVDVSVVRPNGRVDRAVSAAVPARPGDITLAPDVLMPDVKENRPPTIIGPKRVEIKEDQKLEFKISVTDPDPDQTVQVKATGPSFALLAKGGPPVSTGSSASFTYRVILSPGFDDARDLPWQLELIATDGAGGEARQKIDIYVINTNRAPTANGQLVRIDEDTAATIKLTASDPDLGDKLKFTIVDQPLNGTLSGVAPNLTYTPNPNFAGVDGFTFKVNDGSMDSDAMPVTISVRAINDPPVLTVPGSQSAREGQTIDLTIAASDPDAGQKLTITPVGLPAGASFIQSSATSAQFRWTPAFSQAGTYSISFRVADDGIPSLSDKKEVRVTVSDVALFVAPASKKLNEGQSLTFDIAPTSGLPVPVTLTALDLPPGASLQDQGQNLVPGTLRFRWTPDFTQAGIYSISIKATIAPQPEVSEIRQMQITVFDAQHDFAEDPADLTVNGITDLGSPLRGGGAGSSVAVGDLDGDGIDDLAIGAPLDNGAGQVHVFLGRANPKGVVDLAIRPADVTIRGEASGDLFGSSLAIGDINGDRKADLIIGAPAADKSNAPDSGKVYAVPGALAPGVYDIEKIANLKIVGAARDDHLGASVAVGKIGGALAPDSLIIGAPLFDVPGTDAPLTNAGCVYGFYGGTGVAGVIDLGAWSADFTIAGVVADGQLGYSLATGNFNEDNATDIAIGAPSADFGSLKAAGIVYMVPGSPALKGAITPIQVFNGADSGDAAGFSLAMGDLNGDGHSDLIVSAPEADGPNNARPGSGEVYILFGMPSIQGSPSLLTIFGGSVNADQFPDGLGYSVAAGDFTGDGIPDLITGAPGADSPGSTRIGVGAAYMIFGSRNLTAGTFDLTSDAPDLKIFGARPGDRLGAGGFAFGKLDLAGAKDLAIGVPTASKAENASIGAGEVRVLRGVIR
ncbi:MAG TPA: Ig-like domain-containing protein [Blastocatellia bacterium]|nr:Ig-like domain-containing protein [Blastocatellia bacterium]